MQVMLVRAAVGALMMVAVIAAVPTGAVAVSAPAAAGTTALVLGGDGRVSDGSEEFEVFALAYLDPSGMAIAEVSLCERFAVQCTHYGGPLAATSDGAPASLSVVPGAPSEVADHLRVRGHLSGLGDLDLMLFGVEDASPQPKKHVATNTTSSVWIAPTTPASQVVLGGITGQLGNWSVVAAGGGVWGRDVAFAYTGR